MMMKYICNFTKSLFLIIVLAPACLSVSAQNKAGLQKGNLGQAQGSVFSKDIFHSAVFLENRKLVSNLTGEDILYFTSHDNVNAFFAKTGVYYNVCHIADKITSVNPAVHLDVDVEDEGDDGVPIISTTMRMKWIGANANPKVVAGTKSEGYYNFTRKTGKGSQLEGLATVGYKTITYIDLYPGIDVLYTFPEKGGMEYSLIVHPGADVSVVKMRYEARGQGVTVAKDAQGNLVLHTATGDVIEHAPVSFTDGRKDIPTEFTVKGNEVSFKIHGLYNHHNTLTIDPWVTTLTSLPSYNMGMDVDYDFVGNLYVYGAGPTGNQDASTQFQVVKYSPSGNFLWNFNGTVPAVNWTASTDSGVGGFLFTAPSNFCVDKAAGKVYVGQALGLNGAQMIRLNSAGAYDNFESVADPTFVEIWGIVYNCVASTVIGMGGGVPVTTNMGNVNTTTGSVVVSTITGDNTYNQQDIVCGTYDSSGNLYVILNSQLQISPYFEPVLPYTNTIYKVNAGVNGNIWAANSHYTTLAEPLNNPFWVSPNASGYNGNGFNCLSANGQFLYYYDGFHLAAYSLANGTRVGFTTVAGYTALMQSGIAVDNCNNVYVGGQGIIKTFHFSGTTFTATADLPLFGPTGAVLDIKYKQSSNLLYVTGAGFAGVYVATESSTCDVVYTFSATTTNTCNTGTVHIVPSVNLNPKTFNIIWTNSAGTVISQLNDTQDTVNTVTGLSSGTYYVQVQWQPNCGGLVAIDSFTIACDTPTLTVTPDTTICGGQSVMLTAVGTPTGGAYLWAPGGAITASITVTPATSTTYTVTYTPLVGLPLIDTTRVTIVNTVVAVVVNNASACSGNSAMLTATPSVTGGTYLWAPGGATTQSITVTPGATTIYTVTYSLACGTATNTGTVTVGSNPTITLTQNVTCSSGDNVIYVTGGAGTTPYQYELNNSGYQAIDSFTSLSTGTDSVHLTDANGCSASAAITLVTVNGSSVSLTETPASCAGGDGAILATATSGQPPFQFNINNGAYQASNTFSALNVGFYTIGVKDANGCINQDTISVTTSNPVTLGLTTTPVSCAGSDGTITATPAGGATPYQYAVNGGAFQASNSFTGLNAGFYTIQVKDANTCAATDTITVTTLPNTVGVTLTMTPVSCAGGDGTITATGSGGTSPYTYALNGAAYQASGSFTGLSIGFFTVQVKDAVGCVNSDTITVTTSNPQTLTVTVVNPVCAGDSGTITAVGGGGVQPFQYAINGGAWQASGIFDNLGGGTYTITTQDANTCSATATATVNPAPAPVVLTMTVTPDSCPGKFDGTLTAATTGGNGPYTYIWSNGTTSSSNFIGNLPTGTYSVTATDANNCTGTDTATVIALPGIMYTAMPHNVFCPPLHDGYVVVTVDSASLPVTYRWNTGQQSSSIYMLAQGTYSLTLTNAAGCVVDTSFVVGNDSAFSVSVFPADTTIQLGNSAAINLIPHGDGISFMYWDPSEYVVCDTCASTNASPIQTILYKAFVTSDSGCIGMDSILITVVPFYNIFIPDAFTPNGDGNNDFFSVYGEKSDWKEFTVRLFDRWGEKVFESHDMNFAWDGRYKGKLMTPQVLVYEINVVFMNNHTAPLYKGSVTLIR